MWTKAFWNVKGEFEIFCVVNNIHSSLDIFHFIFVKETKKLTPCCDFISEPARAYVYVLKNECMYCMYAGVTYIHIQNVHMCVYFYPQVHMSVCVCIVCVCVYVSAKSGILDTNIYIQIHGIHAHTCKIKIHTYSHICTFICIWLYRACICKYMPEYVCMMWNEHVCACM